MIPRTLSASSIDLFEKCPAAFRATYMQPERANDIANQAANNGTAVHAALELYVQTMLAQGTPPSQAELLAWYEVEYRKLFGQNDSFFADGNKMLTDWYNRQSWVGRQVLSTELKERLQWKTPAGVIPVTYIWDRCDKIPNPQVTWPDAFDVEVVDYKTVRAPVSPAQMRDRVQVRIYALTAKLKYPEAERIIVTYDLLRYGPVSVVFTTDELRGVHRYLKDVTKRILDDEGDTETLNRDCNYCIRRHKCDELRKHVNVGGQLSALVDVDDVTDTRRRYDEAVRGLSSLRDECDVWLLEWCEAADTLDLETDTTALAVKARGSDKVDPERVETFLRTAVVGDLSWTAEFKPFTAKSVKAMIAENRFDAGVESALRQLIRREFSAPRIETSVKKKK